LEVGNNLPGNDIFRFKKTLTLKGRRIRGGEEMCKTVKPHDIPERKKRKVRGIKVSKN